MRSIKLSCRVLRPSFSHHSKKGSHTELEIAGDAPLSPYFTALSLLHLQDLNTEAFNAPLMSHEDRRGSCWLSTDKDDKLEFEHKHSAFVFLVGFTHLMTLHSAPTVHFHDQYGPI